MDLQPRHGAPHLLPTPAPAEFPKPQLQVSNSDPTQPVSPSASTMGTALQSTALLRAVISLTVVGTSVPAHPQHNRVTWRQAMPATAFLRLCHLPEEVVAPTT
jgi:hypothetical protein